MYENQWESVAHHTSDMCAHSGSSSFFVSIPGSHIVVNGPLWCYFYAVRYVERARWGASIHFSCTQPNQEALVYGAEKDILRTLASLKGKKLERIFLESTVGVSLIGDDLKGIAAKAGMDCPVYTLDSVGLSGGFTEGYRKAFDVVLREMKEKKKKPMAVNLLGTTEAWMKGREDALEMKRLLEEAGYHVTAMAGAGSTWEEIMHMPEASLNIVVRPDLGLPAAKRMEKDFSIPYIVTGMPYGLAGTKAWLAKIIEALPGGSMEEIEKEAAFRQNHISSAGDFQALWGALWFDRILIAGDGAMAAGLAEAVRSEWADTERLTVILPDDAGEALVTKAADDIWVCGRDEDRINPLFHTWPGGLVMASSMEEAELFRRHRPFLSCPVAYPAYELPVLSDLPFCGFRGAEYLCERLWQAKMEGMRRQRKA